MAKLNISVKECKNQTVAVFLDDNELGIMDDEMKVELTKEFHSIHIKYGEKISNTIKIKSTDTQEHLIEVDKAIKLERLIIMLIPLLLASFSFHMAFGIGYYFFAIASILISVMTYLNWNKLILKEVK